MKQVQTVIKYLEDEKGLSGIKNVIANMQLRQLGKQKKTRMRKNDKNSLFTKRKMCFWKKNQNQEE